ncbi:class I SAM-dependent methyltransferase [Seonamhaeicola maritimus]|uniref:class I SAM-dependent methyltransferase n=1 Tax=Seonamhaeicola maritimus TaxID=2591822 RepID=UPI002494FA59|nr:class I SAM-dependent methyltransferase [Seonamhaeicola maritimus]
MNIFLKIKNALKNSNKSYIELKHHRKKSDDIYSLAILQSLLVGYPYLPLNGGALRPVCIAYILNEIIINQRQHILEFGSGISTIIMARLLKKNGLNARIVTVEHNEAWANNLKTYLKNEDLLQFVEVVRVDLKEITTSMGAVHWYDYKALSMAIKEMTFDLIIIDGPPANTSKLKHSRLPALERFAPNFKADFCLVLDDVHRKGEQDLVAFYKGKNKNVSYEIISETLGVFRTTNKFNPIPIHY